MTLRHQSGRRRRRVVIPLVAFAVGMLTLAMTVLLAGPSERARAQFVDTWQQVNPRVSVSPPIAIVDIDEAALARLGQWPWARSDLAQMTRNLTQAGAAAIAFDIVFAEADRLSASSAVETIRRLGGEARLPDGAVDGDAALARSFAEGPIVAGLILTPEGRAALPTAKAGFAVRGPDPAPYLPNLGGAIANLPALNAAAAGIGSFSLLPEPDGIVRRVPLVYGTASGLMPGLATEALRVAQGAGALQLRVADGGGQPGIEALRVGDFETRTDAEGRLWLHWSGLPDVPRISAARVVLDGAEDWAAQIAGRIVFIGTSAAGLRDLVPTPLGTVVPGVEAHAEALDQMLSGATLARPDWAQGAELMVAVAAGAMLALLLPFVGAGWSAVLAAAGIAGALAGAWTGLGRGTVLDPFPMSLVLIAVFLSGATALALLTERERRSVRRTFSLYLSPAVVERLADDPTAARLDGESTEITILFCDLRGFSGLSEGMDPTELTALLNGFLTPMTEVLLAHGATIDKFIGDAIMAFWNAPLPVADHRTQALLASVEMGRALETLNARAIHGPLSIGIGLNTGTCCVGNLGSAQRFAYSAIGDPVNVAARIEALTRFYGVETLASAETAAASGLATLEVDRVRVKGRDAPVPIQAVLGDADMAAQPAFQRLTAAQARWLAAYRAWDADAARIALAQLDGLPAGLLALQTRRTKTLASDPKPSGWTGLYDPGEKSPTGPD